MPHCASPLCTALLCSVIADRLKEVLARGPSPERTEGRRRPASASETSRERGKRVKRGSEPPRPPTPPGRTVPASFGTALRRFRIAANLSQEALAEKANISTAAVGAYEREIRTAPHRDTVNLLAAALGLSAEARLEFQAAAQPKPRTRKAQEGELTDARRSPGLPSEMTTFVGREAELASIVKLLGEQRVVTITGTGGIGKTRLALQVASRQQRPDGVWFVDLSSLRDGGRIVAKVLSVVPVTTYGGDETPENLAESLRNRNLLIVLDNCEHLTEAVGAVVAALVRYAPNVSVLATSRHRLHVSSEFVYRLSPLSYPDSPPTSTTDARAYGAVELFVSRAHAANRSFVFTDDQIPAVVEICRRVEGIPLAVELAAARLPMFGLTVLKERLRDRLGSLKANVRDAPARQQTLRSTIDWSYNLLADSERLLLQRLAIFSGGCTLNSAEEVCSDEFLTPESIVDGLSSLVDHSLISVEGVTSVPRYSLLEATRQYALEKLPASQQSRLARRHAEWCAIFSDEVNVATHELSRAEWRQMVLPELDNIYQSIDWSAEHDRLLHARIVGSLHFVWWRIGRLDEGRRLAAAALSSIDEDAHPLVAAKLHVARALSLTSSKKFEAARRAIELYERMGEPHGLLEAYIHLGGGYLMIGDVEGIRQVVQRASYLVTRTGERSLAPMISLLRAGVVSLSGNYAEARDELEIALRGPNVSEQEAGFEITYELSSIEYCLGNVERAAALCDELVETARQGRMVHHEMYALVATAGFRLLLGDTASAEEAARESLLLARGHDSTIQTSAIQHLATIAALRGDVIRAAQLHGYVDAWFAREEHKYVNLPAACRDLLIAALDERLSLADKERYMSDGSRMSEGTATAEALLI